MKVYLDDERTPRPPTFTENEEWREDWREWVVVRRVIDAIDLLTTGIVTEISLDHDLGPENLWQTGYEVLLWIEEQVVRNGFKPPKMHVHTANPSAWRKMFAAVKKIQQLAEENNDDGIKVSEASC